MECLHKKRILKGPGFGLVTGMNGVFWVANWFVERKNNCMEYWLKGREALCYCQMGTILSSV